MHLAPLVLIPALLGAILALSGYAAGVHKLDRDASSRLSLALLTGLGLLVLNISLLNLVRPLDATGGMLCLWPVVLGLTLPSARKALVCDLAEILSSSKGRVVAAALTLLPALLLAPMAVRPDLICFDGTSNHDSYFWITSAEILRTQDYLTQPLADLLHPAFNSVGAITGMRPLWGRMGCEGLLACVSSLANLPAETVFLPLTAGLLVVWTAVCHLVIKTFLMEKTPVWVAALICLLQPVFLFAHLNANFPNFLGALFGAGMTVCMEQALRPGGRRWPWLAGLALSIHGILCCYPEMAPFVLLPAGLLWLRSLWLRAPLYGRRATAAALACCAGALLNPATLVRGWVGFIASFGTARANQNWANIFMRLEPPELLPGLVSLCPPAADSIGWVGGSLVTLALITGFILALRRATDRNGALIAMSGSAVLVAYTVVTGFHYGWQKSVQFGGVVVAAWTIASLAALLQPKTPTGQMARLLRMAALVLGGGFLLYASAHAIGRAWWWSERKDLTRDWQQLEAIVRGRTQSTTKQTPSSTETVLIDSGSFDMPFYHGMWATYYLQHTPVVFATRDPEAGGYQRAYSMLQDNKEAPKHTLVLVGAAWAATFDANSPRRAMTPSFVLLEKFNQVDLITGCRERGGVPMQAEQEFVIGITPHSDSVLQMELGIGETNTGPLPWTARVEQGSPGTGIRESESKGAGKLSLQLKAGVRHLIRVKTHPEQGQLRGEFPIRIRGITMAAPGTR